MNKAKLTDVGEFTNIISSAKANGIFPICFIGESVEYQVEGPMMPIMIFNLVTSENWCWQFNSKSTVDNTTITSALSDAKIKTFKGEVW